MNLKITILIILGIALALAGAALLVQTKSPNLNPPGPVACTADAMQCPDGSWVGRTGPNCEFVCPGE